MSPRSRYELTQRLRRNIINVPKCGRDFPDLIGRHLVLFEAHLPFAHGSPDSRDALGGCLSGRVQDCRLGDFHARLISH
jgi:hypothetical protein